MGVDAHGLIAMVKTLCDLCEGEVEPEELAMNLCRAERLRDGVEVTVEADVRVKVGDVWNNGHLCRECVLRVLTYGEDREAREPAPALPLYGDWSRF